MFVKVPKIARLFLLRTGSQETLEGQAKSYQLWSTSRSLEKHELISCTENYIMAVSYVQEHRDNPLRINVPLNQPSRTPMLLALLRIGGYSRGTSQVARVV